MITVISATLRQLPKRMRQGFCAVTFLLPLMLILLAGSVEAAAQSFGLPLMKSKTILQRKLPALVQLPAGTVNIIVTAHAGQEELKEDFRSMLGSELLKEDPRLSVADDRGDTTITCMITAFDHPPATTSTRPGVQTGKTAASPVTYTRVTGMMRVSFQTHTRNGRNIGSDNITSKYDEEFDSSGNSLSGGITHAFKNSINRVKGGKSEEMNPPTDAELLSKLIDGAVRQIVVELVNTRETVEVLLAKGKGPMDEGVKYAEGGLWTRALEVWETAPALPRPVEDAYRLYDIGVANEALAYASDDDYKTATKYLDEAAIDYGKAIDSNPAEKYFIEPQKRIESALAHYHKLEEEAKTPPPAPPAPKPVAAPAPVATTAPTPAKKKIIKKKITHTTQ
jgi:hypothetical protein